MATEKDVREIYLKGVRLSYPHLLEKHKATDDATPKFSASFLIDPDTKEGKLNIKKIERALEKACQEAFGKSYDSMRFKADRIHFKDGNEQFDKDGEIKQGYEDRMVVTASNQSAPTLLTRAKKNIDRENSPFYGGCFVEAIVRFYGTKKGGAPGLFATLEAVRFFEDGDSFGSAPISPDAFDDYDDEDFDDDDDLGLDD